MSVYQTIGKVGSKLFSKNALFKYGFNLSPMYRRSTGRILTVSEDLKRVTIKIPISYRNRNYVNSIFGGSLFSAVDPIPMVQLINIIGDDYVVWDKSAVINFRIPARESVYAEFLYGDEEISSIIRQVADKKEIEIVKTTRLTDREQTKVYCEVSKTIYIADKAFFKEKRKRKQRGNP